MKNRKFWSAVGILTTLSLPGCGQSESAPAEEAAASEEITGAEDAVEAAGEGADATSYDAEATADAAENVEGDTSRGDEGDPKN